MLELAKVTDLRRGAIDDAFAHATALVGLVAESQPKLGEPLDCAMSRVQAASGIDHPAESLKYAGLRAIINSEVSGDFFDRLEALFCSIPDWLATFTLAQVSAHVLSWPKRDLSAVPALSASSTREALAAWPGLPRGAAIVKEG